MRYPGGKGRCFQHIVSLIPPHRVYIETHLGGGAVLRKKRPAISSIACDLDPQVVRSWTDLAFPGLKVLRMDACAFLRAFTFHGDEFVYCDPPYLRDVRSCDRRLYRFDYDQDQHVELLGVLRRLEVPVMLSGYASALYDELLPDWRCFAFPGDSHAGPRLENVWLNYDPAELLHDYAHLGRDFRERERIRRRRAGLTRRIAGMAPLERNALFAELAVSNGDDMRAALSGTAS